MNRLIGILLCLFALPMHAGALDWPVIESPPKSRVQWVGQDMKLNGVPMRIQQFSSGASVGEVLNYYRALWGNMAEKKSVEKTVGKRQTIGKWVGEYYLSIQVQPDGLTSSSGYMVINKMVQKKDVVSSQHNFPVMPGGSFYSELESNDPGQTATTITMLNQASVDSNADFFKGRLAAQDWKLDKQYGGPQQNGAAHALFFRRDKQEAMVIVSKNAQGTSVVANVLAHTGK